MDYLSDAWIDALQDAAARRVAPDPDPLDDVHVRIEQVVTGSRTWRLIVDGGTITVEDGAGDHDVRLTTDPDTSAAIAAGRRSALDAFSAGELRLGGDVSLLLEHGPALAALGDLFASVRASTFGDDA